MPGRLVFLLHCPDELVNNKLLRLYLVSILLVLWGLGGACAPPQPPSGLEPSRDARSDVGADAQPDARPGTQADADPTCVPDPNGDELTIATYNTYLLFDTICDSGRCHTSDFEQKRTQQEFDERIAQVAAAIDALGADIVMLQEVEKQPVLDALNEALENPYPVAYLAESGYPGSLDVAVLARGEARDIMTYLQLEDSQQTFTRPLLRVDLQINCKSVIAFAAHFRSKVGDDPNRRLAEARTTRQIVGEVAAQNQDALLLLGGDLNDTPDSDMMQELTGNGGLVWVAEGKRLIDVYTIVHNSMRMQVDHLLLAPSGGGAYVPDSVRSVHDHNPVGYGGSDHGALVGRFEMR